MNKKSIVSAFSIASLSVGLRNPLFEDSKLPFTSSKHAVRQLYNAAAVPVTFLPLSIVVSSIGVGHLAHAVDSVITPLALIDCAIYELLIASSLAIMVVPFADVIRPVWLYLTTISMHFVFFELSFI